MSIKVGVGENGWIRNHAFVGIGITMIGCVLHFFRHDIPALIPNISPGEWKDFLSAVLSVSGAMAGFIVTAKSVMLTSTPTETMEKFVAGGGFVAVVRVMSAVSSLTILLAALASILILFVQAPFRGYLDAMWIGLFVTTALGYFRFTKLFLKYATTVSEERETEAKNRRQKREQEERARIEAKHHVKLPE